MTSGMGRRWINNRNVGAKMSDLANELHRVWKRCELEATSQNHWECRELFDILPKVIRVLDDGSMDMATDEVLQVSKEIVSEVRLLREIVIREERAGNNSGLFDQMADRLDELSARLRTAVTLKREI